MAVREELTNLHVCHGLHPAQRDTIALPHLVVTQRCGRGVRVSSHRTHPTCVRTEPAQAGGVVTGSDFGVHVQTPPGVSETSFTLRMCMGPLSTWIAALLAGWQIACRITGSGKWLMP